MTDIERQELWVKLQTELADVYERQALGDSTGNKTMSYDANVRACEITAALGKLKQARSIRSLLAKIEAIGEAT